MTLAEMAHHTAPRGQSMATAGLAENEVKSGLRVLETLPHHAAGFKCYSMDYAASRSR